MPLAWGVRLGGELEIATAWLRRGLRLGACEEVTRRARQWGADAGSGASRPPGRTSTNGRSTRPSKCVRCTPCAAHCLGSAPLLGEVATTELPLDQPVLEAPEEIQTVTTLLAHCHSAALPIRSRSSDNHAR